MMSNILARETFIKVWCVNSKMFWDPTSFRYDNEKKMYEDTSKWAIDWRNDVSRIDRNFESFYPLTDSINRPIYFQENPEITKKYSKGESGRLYILEFNLLDFKYFYHKYNKYTFDNGKSGACSIVEDPEHIVNLFHKYNNFQYLWYKDPKEKNKFYKGKVIQGHYEKYQPGESHDEDLKYVHEHWVTVFDEVGFKNWLTQATAESNLKIQSLNAAYEQWLHNERNYDQDNRYMTLKNNEYVKEIADLKKKLAAFQAAEKNEKDFDSISPKQKRKQNAEKYAENEKPVIPKFDWPEDEKLSKVERTILSKRKAQNSLKSFDTKCSNGMDGVFVVTRNVGKKYGWGDEGIKTAFHDLVKVGVADTFYLKALIDSGRLNDGLLEHGCGYTYHDDTLNAFRDEIIASYNWGYN